MDIVWCLVIFVSGIAFGWWITDFVANIKRYRVQKLTEVITEEKKRDENPHEDYFDATLFYADGTSYGLRLGQGGDIFWATKLTGRRRRTSGDNIRTDA